MKEIDRCENPDDQTKELDVLRVLMHENVVKYLDQPDDFEYTGENYPIFMEYCEEGSMRNVIDDSRIVYSVATIVKWAQELFTSLVYLKKMRIAHRDIKPENIFVAKHFVLKVGDFGVIKRVESTKTTVHGSVGTWLYMMPEVREGIQLNGENLFKADVYGAGLVLWEIIERKLFKKEESIRFSAATDCLKIEKLNNLIISCSSSQIALERRIDAGNALKVAISLEKYFAKYEFLPEIQPNQTCLTKPIGLESLEEQSLSTINPPDATFGSDHKENTEEKPKEIPLIVPTFLLNNVLPKIKRTTNLRNISVSWPLRKRYLTSPKAKVPIRLEICDMQLCNVNEYRAALASELLKIHCLSDFNQFEQQTLISEIKDILKKFAYRSFYNNISRLREDHYRYLSIESTAITKSMLAWLNGFTKLVSFDFILQRFCQQFSIFALWNCASSTITSKELIELLDLSIHNTQEMQNVFSRREGFLLWYLDDSKHEWCQEFGLLFRKDLGEIRAQSQRGKISPIGAHTPQRRICTTPIDLEMIRRRLSEEKNLIISYSRGKERKKLCAEPLKEFLDILTDAMAGSFLNPLMNGLRNLPKNDQELQQQFITISSRSRFPEMVYFVDAIPEKIIFPFCPCPSPCATEYFPAGPTEELRIKYSACDTLRQREFLETHSLFERAFCLIDDWENLILCHCTNLFLTEKLLREIETKQDPSFGFYFIYLEEKPWPSYVLKQNKLDKSKMNDHPMKSGLVLGLDLSNRTSFLGRRFSFERLNAVYLWEYRGLIYISLYELENILKIIINFLQGSEMESDMDWKDEHQREFCRQMNIAIDEFWEYKEIK